MEKRDVQQKMRGILNRMLMLVRHFPHTHEELRNLAVELIELLDEDHG